MDKWPIAPAVPGEIKFLSECKEACVPTSTLTSKGQITLPVEVRRALDLNAGDKLDFVPLDAGGFMLVPVRTDVRRLRGRFAGRVVRPATLEEMDAAIAAGVASALRAAP